MNKSISRDKIKLMAESGMYTVDIAKELGCSTNSITRICHELNISLPKHHTKAKLTKKKLEEAVNSGKPLRILAKEMNCSPTTIQRTCKRLRVSLPKHVHHRTRSKTFNTRFFENIDSEEKAYILGFISADGGRDRNWGVKIAIHEKDMELLENIASVMNCSYKPTIVENGTRAKLGLYDIDMVSDLTKYGITENKTFTIPFAQNIPEHLVIHYVRGVFDGDGSLTCGRREAAFVTGSKDFRDGFVSWFKSVYGYEPWNKLYKNTYRFHFYKRDAKFITDMYRNSKIHLKRKYNLFLENWEVMT